jgi:hypothetical protein
MKHLAWVLLVAMLMLGLLGTAPVSAQSQIDIQNPQVKLEFPDRLTFTAHIVSAAAINRVTLEYGVEKLTCGTVVAKAFPNFTPGLTADVIWTWEMRRSGSEPPGSTIWYRWRVADSAGNERVSEKQWVAWLDDIHQWNTVSSDNLNLHWYAGTPEFGMQLLDSAVASLKHLKRTTGVTLDAPTDLYIYAGTDDMREAVLYEPGWTGGLAFPDSDIVIIGIGPDQLAWGKRTVAHELTHVLIGHRTFSCLGSLPTWLNEGIAVYGEGGPDKVSIDRLSAAISHDKLISLRALSGNFSEDPRKADLSYAQSYSVVSFLVAGFGQAKLLKLFDNLGGGMKLEDSLNDAYGFGLDGLEERWRAAVGAPSRQSAGIRPTVAPSVSPVPTYQPIAVAPLAAATGAVLAAPDTAVAPPFTATVWVILGGSALIVLGIVAATWAVIARKRKST